MENVNDNEDRVEAIKEELQNEFNQADDKEKYVSSLIDDVYGELNITVGEMKEGDRVHFFWANFPDGSTVNGGSNIIKVSEEVDAPSSEWMEQEGWSEDKLEEFEKLRKSNKLVLVTLQTDYHSPSNVVMEKEMFVKVIRKEQI